MNVADWLHMLGLGEYEAAFRENSVTVDLLPNLTLEDLKDLGITLVGHRRRLLDAIAALRANANLAEVPRAASAEQRRPSEQSTAERRQLSVMFCDLMDSTPLSSRLDPEELSVVIHGYQARVAAIIPRFGGFIARYVGDGILIYFGWPEAHEANAERAVRAAVAVTDAIAQAAHACRTAARWVGGGLKPETCSPAAACQAASELRRTSFERRHASIVLISI